MPAVQIDLARVAAGRRGLWVLLLAATLALSWGQPLVPIVLLPVLLLVLARRGRAPEGTLCFDGRSWWLCRDSGSDEKLRAERAGYSGPGIIALQLDGKRRRCLLLVWCWQLDRESWRRLCLAVRYGTSTVSTASDAVSG